MCDRLIVSPYSPLQAHACVRRYTFPSVETVTQVVKQVSLCILGQHKEFCWNEEPRCKMQKEQKRCCAHVLRLTGWWLTWHGCFGF